MPVKLVSKDFLGETIHNEIPLTGEFEYLSKALPDIASNHIAIRLQSESNDTRLSESLDKYKRSVIDKALNGKNIIPAHMVSAFIDSYLAIIT
jgi:predicted metalloenzyme YecM